MSRLDALWEERQKANAEFCRARDSGADRATKRHLWEQYARASMAFERERDVCPTCGRPMPYEPEEGPAE